MRNLAHLLKMNRPNTGESDIDWSRVDDSELAVMASEVVNPEYRTHFSEDHVTRVQALNQNAGGNLTVAAALWSQQAQPPRTQPELTLIGEGLAAAGDIAALEFAAQLDSLTPGSAHSIRARLALGMGSMLDAKESMTAALRAFQSSPWVPRAVMMRTLDLIINAPSLAPFYFELLAEPFAEYKLDGHRKAARVAIAQYIPGDACATALAEFEPYVPWDEDFLRKRLKCYQDNNYERMTKIAKEDLDEFFAN
jgi:hypothetical protein